MAPQADPIIDTATHDIFVIREAQAIEIARRNEPENDAMIRVSVLNFRNKPYGILSILTCIANKTNDKTIADAATSELPIAIYKDRKLKRKFSDKTLCSMIICRTGEK